MSFNLKSALIAFAGLAMLTAFSGQLAAEDKGEWVELLPGGEHAKYWISTGNWNKEGDDALTLTPREGEKGWQRYDAYLWSNKEYDDFEVEFEYKLEAHGNSGFYFNVGDRKDPVSKGIEVQIYDSYGKDDAKKLTDHDSGGIIPRIPPTQNAAKAAGEWNKFHITVKGNQLTVELNGKVVNEVKLGEGTLQGRPDSGYIGFQDHGLPLSLRNIRVRSL